MLIVDDHPVLAQSTRSLFLSMQLADEIDVCHTAAHTIATLQGDADWFRIWLDIDVPGARGLSLIRKVHELGLARRAAVITAVENPDWQVEIKSMNFLGYVPKATGFEAFKHAVQHIVQGREYFEGLQQHRPPSRLTKRQVEILKLVARGHASKEVARQLKLTPGTVDNHVSAIVDALCAKGRTHAVALAIEYGYIPPEA
ncbi:response regulator transcription factor [Aquabacterium sp. A7-Y]|uniref:response regulator transcription factor n=1 Tax=Aquabacterium sp. A7-Y TaxID=1349605 RepID=UPI00223D0BED|nr:response regulator transcription factor [Aquabacterium sp. A7-Y]MCW7540123.1 response regulator transcription factor [Aquabacterium sp. A7-Y]